MCHVLAINHTIVYHSLSISWDDFTISTSMASSGISQPAIFMSCTLLIQAADSLQHPLADLSQACPKHSRRYPWAPLGESANYGWGIFYRIPTAHKI